MQEMFEAMREKALANSIIANTLSIYKDNIPIEIVKGLITLAYADGLVDNTLGTERRIKL